MKVVRRIGLGVSLLTGLYAILLGLNVLHSMPMETATLISVGGLAVWALGMESRQDEDSAALRDIRNSLAKITEHADLIATGGPE